MKIHAWNNIDIGFAPFPSKCSEHHADAKKIIFDFGNVLIKLYKEQTDINCLFD